MHNDWTRRIAFYILILGLLGSACNFPTRETTAVPPPTEIIPLTETHSPTSIGLPTEVPTETVSPTNTTISATATPTSTISLTATGTEPSLPSSTPVSTPAGEAGLPSGNPAWSDTFSTNNNWFSGGSVFENEDVKFEIVDGKMKMTAFNPNFREGWVLSWPKPDNFYLEGIFKTIDCSGRDRFGLFVRAENVSENPRGYLFGIRCDGRYSLRIFDGEFTDLIDWILDERIESGSGKSHRLGIWANDNTLRLYIDRELVAEIEDNTFTSGPFGLFIGSAETPNLHVEVDELSYWNIP